MRWIYQQHGLRTEPSGAIAIAAALTGKVTLEGEGDIALVVSGRNVDDERFRAWTEGV
jgi:threonine dehydratase